MASDARHAAHDIRLRQIADNQAVLQIDMHHIAADGGCYARLIADLFAA